MLRLRSECTLGGLPLVDIAIGRNPQSKNTPGRAEGIIAIGDHATGGIAIGGVARGVIAVGGIALGGVSLGGIAVGAIALGGIVVGNLVMGGLAIGVDATGGIAIGLKSRGRVTIDKDGAHPPALPRLARRPRPKLHLFQHYVSRFFR